jgi:hypothetical protein
MAIHAPIIEENVKETEAKNVAADVLDWITDRAVLTTLFRRDDSLKISKIN